MSKNRYHISVTLETTVEVEAENEHEADAMVSDAVYEEGYGDLQIVGTHIVETIIDGPAKYKAWMKAWNAWKDAELKYGIDSAEAHAAQALVPEDMGV